MRPLTGIDSLFLSLESQTNLFQVGAVSVLDPSTAPEESPPPYEAVRRVVESRLDRLPPFRTRLVTVPWGLDHPRWVEDEPDLDRHIRRAALPAPGGERELACYAADALARPLDRNRPLWELHVVEGLEGGLVAGVAKLHHSAIDGVAGTEVTANLMDLSPKLAEAQGPCEMERDTVPGPVALLRGAASNARRRALPTARLLGRLTGTAARLRARNRLLGGPPPPAIFSAPRTSLAARLGPERVVGLARVDLADVEAVRQATRATVNDVILALAASALRVYLEERGELPKEPLCGFVPISVRGQGDTLIDGVNRLSGMLVSLATDIADPVLRLAAIAEGSRVAKEQHRVLGEDLFSELATLGVPALLGPIGRALRGLGVTTRFPPFSVVVSSFPGPSFPLYCGGAELMAYHPFGPIIDGAALNITAMSYRGQIGFGLLGCRDAVPDIDLVARLIPESMNQLTKALSAAGHRRRRPAEDDHPLPIDSH
jgi:diacylglycerol O-acyltransferase / wax synthase